MIRKGTSTLVAGSGSKIYETVNNGSTWVEYSDLDAHKEGSGPIEGISDRSLYNDNVVAGTTNGRIFVETG
jgi:hypothetical protein